MTPKPGDGRDQRDEIVQFGGDRPPGRLGGGWFAGRRWWSRALLACLVLATVVTVAVRSIGHQTQPTANTPPPPPALRITTVGHRLLGVRAGWELFARGPDDLLRIELARGRIVQTYVPPLETANPDVAFVIGAHEVVIRSTDLVPGYVVPDGGQARLLTGSLADGGPLVPGPAGTQTAWIASGSPASPALFLITLAGHRSGPVIRFGPGGPQLPVTAVSDGRGGVLVTSGDFTVYDAGPGWDRPVPGAVIAVGRASLLIIACNPMYGDCHNEVADAAGGPPRVLAGPPATVPYYASWPPSGVIAPDGRTAAVAEGGPRGGVTVHLIDLRTGATRDLGLRLGGPGSDLPNGTDPNEHAMAWSPDSHWLFVAAAGGRLLVVNAQTGRAQSLGARLPAVDQVAVRG